ncbi:hypothetical protein HDU98_004892 [Podochytrium sp. JEL0797]|nr:hypothetical protein HDU98_004892 [Podochytrium sp. JEL0797]
MHPSVLHLLASLAVPAFAAITQSANTKVSPLYNVLVPKWQGFGTSLSWWGCEAGASSSESKYADLFFTNKTTSLTINNTQVALPGLGLNVVRYNIGGTGRPGDFPNASEYFEGSVAPGKEWWKLVEGFWVNGVSNDIQNWDWTRDANQRSMLQAAIGRGVQNVEFFSNAPMWWMTAQNSSLGGSLTSSAFDLFPEYVATVVSHATYNWNINVSSVSILNEPSAGWWNFPNITQEGVNVVNKSDKVTLLQNLRTRLNTFGLEGVLVTGAEEYNYDYGFGQLDGILPVVDQYNVHGYQTSVPARTQLRNAVAGKPLWMSEYGDPDNSGMSLATQILNDINVFQPSAWVYWQVLENSVWGMLYANNFGASANDATRAEPSAVTTKYYVFAQFTRFIQPGDEILESGSPNVVVARNPVTNVFKFVVVNYMSSQTVTLNLNGITKPLPASVNLTYTATDGSVLFGSCSSKVVNKHVVFAASKNSVYSIEI